MKIPEQNDFEKIVYKKRGEKKHVFLKKLLEEMQWHLRCFRFLKPAELPIYCCTADYRRLPIGCRPQIPVAYILKIHISSTAVGHSSSRQQQHQQHVPSSTAAAATSYVRSSYERTVGRRHCQRHYSSYRLQLALVSRRKKYV